MTMPAPEDRPSLSLTRTYDASPEEVWRAWTDAEALKIWFKPEEAFTFAAAEADVRVGGLFRIVMISGKGKEHEISGVYREVIPNEKLVMTWTWNSAPDVESLLTVILRPFGNGTQLELKHEGIVEIDDRISHEEGWKGSLALLDRYLAAPGQRITRST
jgi:uncharacterized protein YndB with AHSA1/START domain